MRQPAPRLAALRSERDIDIVTELILNNHRPRGIRVDSRHALDPRAVRVRVAPRPAQHDGALGDELAELRHHVVVDLEGVRARARVDGDEAAARGARPAAGEVRAVRVIGAEGPRHGARRPVLQGAHGEVCRLAPGGGLGRGPALGHVLLDVWVGVVEVGQGAPVVVVGVAVPGYAGDVLGCRVKDCLGVAGYVCGCRQRGLKR